MHLDLVPIFSAKNQYLPSCGSYRLPCNIWVMRQRVVMSGQVHLSWASERPNVVLLPVAKLVEDIRAAEGFSIGEHRWPRGRSPEGPGGFCGFLC